MLVLLGNNGAGMENILGKECVPGRIYYKGDKRMDWGLSFLTLCEIHCRSDGRLLPMGPRSGSSKCAPYTSRM